MTRERKWENRRHRSWTPAMIRSATGKKKGGRECRPSTRGRMRRRCWRPSNTTLFNQPAVPWASFTNCQKKGVFPKHPRVRRIAPSPKKQPNDDVRFNDWSSPSRQNEVCGQHPKKKPRSLAAMGRSAYQGSLVPTATTALLQPEA